MRLVTSGSKTATVSGGVSRMSAAVLVVVVAVAGCGGSSAMHGGLSASPDARPVTPLSTIPPLGQPYSPAAIPVPLSQAQASTPVLLPETGVASTAGLGGVYLSTYPYTDAPNAPTSHTVELWYPSSGIEILEYPLLAPDSAATWLAGERASGGAGAPSFVSIDGTTAAVDESFESAVSGRAFVGLVLDHNIVVEITGTAPTTLTQLESVAASM